MAQLVKVLTAFGVYHGGRESTPVSCALTSVGTLWPCSLCTGTVRNPVADVAAQNGYSSPSSLGASPPFPVINLSPRRQTGTATLGCKAGCPQRRNRSQSDTELSSDHPFPRAVGKGFLVTLCSALQTSLRKWPGPEGQQQLSQREAGCAEAVS